jgi:polyhydroxyalkanoate synthesis regulator protein
MKNLIRYKNRKIYDSDIRGYVNLDDILNMMLEGHKVTVTERETGKDITAIIYSQVLSEVVAKERSFDAKIVEKLILSSYEEKTSTQQKSVDTKAPYNYTN